jgi:hypothetical protein
MEAQRSATPHSRHLLEPTERLWPRAQPPGGRIMLDVILDCFGALLLLGQAVWILAKGEIEALPN